MKEYYQRCPHRYYLWSSRLHYHRYSMKYIGYIAFFVFPVYAGLDNIFQSNHGLPGESVDPGAGESGIARFFESVVTMLQDITAIAAVIGICLVGIMYIMSHGNEEKTE